MPTTLIINVPRVFKLPKPIQSGLRQNRASPASAVRLSETEAPWVCHYCGTVMPASSKRYRPRMGRGRVKTLAPGLQLCERCLRSFYLCGICGVWHHCALNVSRNMSLAVPDGSVHVLPVCNTCVPKYVYVCSTCSGTFQIPAKAVGADGKYYCEGCAAAFKPCEECESLLPPNTRLTRGHMVCPTCVQQWSPRNLGSYSFRPEPVFYSAKSGVLPLHEEDARRELFLGVELEIDDGIRGSKLVSELRNFPYFYAKHDGSLSDQGIELVTYPASLETHKTFFAWEYLLRTCRDDYQYKSDTAGRSCGLHVHMNRAFLDDRFTGVLHNTLPAHRRLKDRRSAVLLRLIAFVYGHSSEYIALARRNNTQYASMGRVSSVKDLRSYDAASMLTRDHGDLGRYQALNFRNAATIEWRMFKGTMDYSTLMASLELVDATSRFVLGMSAIKLLKSGKGSTWHMFCDFIEENKSSYTYLPNYMKSVDVWRKLK